VTAQAQILNGETTEEPPAPPPDNVDYVALLKKMLDPNIRNSLHNIFPDL
jgi:hypothetical protein